ncbi:DUF5362 domain-containing protein [Oleiagrimonas soli]|uniref:Transmembrane protein n=1 Tax=Oleiagrimonas soli TaxID=1543381 RepID=A0A099CZM4_9GAMM|nr:DUF5362 domain-containing protein [Oleiagrimonas soli]KGI78465.1 hypothetical protein LF63_0103000 [Oleiagrimonas soli]MBB6184286.1 hypothetical protein [Oleiagrimonas soli]
MNDDRSAIVRELSTPLAGAKGWMKFLGIMFIIQGVFTALSIVGILIAWLPIWIGVLLNQSAGALERAHASGDEAAFRMSLDKLRSYFVIQGVLMLIGIILGVLMILFYGAVIAAMISSGKFH